MLQRRRKSKFNDDPAALREAEARNSELEDALENVLGLREENMNENEWLREIIEPQGSQSANESTRRTQPRISRKVGKIAELPGANVMSVVIFISVIELVLSLSRFWPDEKQDPKTFKSIFQNWKLTQTIYIPISSRLWPASRKNGSTGCGA